MLKEPKETASKELKGNSRTMSQQMKTNNKETEVIKKKELNKNSRTKKKFKGTMT